MTQLWENKKQNETGDFHLLKMILMENHQCNLKKSNNKILNVNHIVFRSCTDDGFPIYNISEETLSSIETYYFNAAFCFSITVFYFCSTSSVCKLLSFYNICKNKIVLMNIIFEKNNAKRFSREFQVDVFTITKNECPYLNVNHTTSLPNNTYLEKKSHLISHFNFHEHVYSTATNKLFSSDLNNLVDL